MQKVQKLKTDQCMKKNIFNCSVYAAILTALCIRKKEVTFIYIDSVRQKIKQ